MNPGKDAGLHIYKKRKTSLDLYYICVIDSRPVLITDMDKRKDVSDFISFHLGHVAGMCKLRLHLQGTFGEWVAEFWLDIERLRHLSEDSTFQRALKVRQIQIKYFTNEEIPKIYREEWNAILGISIEIVSVNLSTCVNTKFLTFRFYHRIQ